MKKIYMILAAMALLSLSLNAQVQIIRGNRSSQNSCNSGEAMTTPSVRKAPMKIDLPEGQHLVGPYTSDAVDYRDGFTSSSYSNKWNFVGVILEPEDFEQYLGYDVIAFRAEFGCENDVAGFYIYQIKEDDSGNITIGTYQSLEFNGDYQTYDGQQWITASLDDPIQLNLEDGYNKLMIGYAFYQYYASDYLYPMGFYSGSTGHTHLHYVYSTDTWSVYSDNPGDLALQLIVQETAKTATPNITYTLNDDGRTVTINLNSGDYPEGTEFHMYVDGNEVPFPYTVGRSSEGAYDIIVTATAQEDGKRISDEASRRITIPQSTLPMSAMPGINYVEGEVTGELTWTCSSPGEVHMYIDGREVTSPWYLERLENDYNVVVRVTNLEAGHSMATYTETITVHGRGTITIDDTWTELPGTFNDNDVINWGKNMMFIDRFTQDTRVYKDIKTKYVYHMEENKAVEPRKTNEKDVLAYKSVSKVQGFYPLDSVLADVDRNHMKMNVVNANVKMDLEHNSDIYYYTLDRALKHEGVQGIYNELSELQRSLGGQYTEKGDFYKQETFDNFQGNNKLIVVDRLDSINVATGEYGIIQGEWSKDYMNYVPVLWTFGFDRVNYDNDKKNNSYGSPIWTVSPGDVVINPGSPRTGTGTYLERQAKNANGDWNPYVNWKDENDNDCSLYMFALDADGILPLISDPDFQNVDYEPYMFRVWVECDGLRNFDVNPDNGHAVNNTTADRTSPRLIFEKRVDETHISVPKIEDVSTPAYPIPANPETPTNIMFGATNSSSKHFIIRFYYKVKEDVQEPDPENPEGGEGGQKRLNRDGEESDPMYNGSEKGFDPDEYTDVHELNYNGEVVGVTYVNPQGLQSSKPFEGVNIVITRYSNGMTKTTKMIMK